MRPGRALRWQHARQRGFRHAAPPPARRRARRVRPGCSPAQLSCETECIWQHSAAFARTAVCQPLSTHPRQRNERHHHPIGCRRRGHQSARHERQASTSARSPGDARQADGVPCEHGTKSSDPAMMLRTGQVMFLKLTICLPTGIRFWVSRFFW